jgi:hypothetical protein
MARRFSKARRSPCENPEKQEIWGLFSLRLLEAVSKLIA